MPYAKIQRLSGLELGHRPFARAVPAGTPWANRPASMVYSAQVRQSSAPAVLVRRTLEGGVGWREAEELPRAIDLELACPLEGDGDRMHVDQSLMDSGFAVPGQR